MNYYQCGLNNTKRNNMEEKLEKMLEEHHSHYNDGGDRVFNDYGVRELLKRQADNIIEELEMHISINEHDWSRNPQAQLRDFIEQFKKK